MADQDIKEFKANEISCASATEILGAGSYGVVRLGYHKLLGPVALKCAKEKLGRDDQNLVIKTIKREVGIIQKANHANIVRVHGWTRWSGFVAIIMEFLARGNLRYLLLEEDHQLSWLLLLRFAYEIANGLAFLHNYSKEKFLVHGDIKPENVILSDDLHCKIADFGGAKIRSYLSTTTDTTSSENKQNQFTEYYAPPEVLKNPNCKRYPQQDTYSYGITLHMILSRKVPFPWFQVHRHHLHLITTGELRPSVEDIEMNRIRLCEEKQQDHASILECLKTQMEGCWSQNPADRPAMADVNERLHTCFTEHNSGSVINQHVVDALNSMDIEERQCPNNVPLQKIDPDTTTSTVINYSGTSYVFDSGFSSGSRTLMPATVNSGCGSKTKNETVAPTPAPRKVRNHDSQPDNQSENPAPLGQRYEKEGNSVDRKTPLLKFPGSSSAPHLLVPQDHQKVKQPSISTFQEKICLRDSPDGDYVENIYEDTPYDHYDVTRVRATPQSRHTIAPPLLPKSGKEDFRRTPQPPPSGGRDTFEALLPPRPECFRRVPLPSPPPPDYTAPKMIGGTSNEHGYEAAPIRRPRSPNYFSDYASVKMGGETVNDYGYEEIMRKPPVNFHEEHNKPPLPPYNPSRLTSDIQVREKIEWIKARLSSSESSGFIRDKIAKLVSIDPGKVTGDILSLIEEIGDLSLSESMDDIEALASLMKWCIDLCENIIGKVEHLIALRNCSDTLHKLSLNASRLRQTSEIEKEIIPLQLDLCERIKLALVDDDKLRAEIQSRAIYSVACSYKYIGKKSDAMKFCKKTIYKINKIFGKEGDGGQEVTATCLRMMAELTAHPEKAESIYNEASSLYDDITARNEYEVPEGLYEDLN